MTRWWRRTFQSERADSRSRSRASLTGTTRTAVRRQQTLRASVDWSHALLTEAERVARFGFLPSELEREKTNLLRGYEQAFDDDNRRGGNDNRFV